MKKVIAGLAACVAGVLMAVAPLGTTAGLDRHSAVGEGSFQFGKAGHGYFNFNLRGGAHPHGTLVFGAENHHGYPSVVIRLDVIERVRLAGNRVTMLAKGHLHDVPVKIRMTAIDGYGPNPDTFEIETRGHLNGDGDIDPNFHAAGSLTRGSITVGLGES